MASVGPFHVPDRPKWTSTSAARSFREASRFGQTSTGRTTMRSPTGVPAFGRGACAGPGTPSTHTSEQDSAFGERWKATFDGSSRFLVNRGNVRR
jgi:hypothetical protein